MSVTYEDKETLARIGNPYTSQAESRNFDMFPADACSFNLKHVDLDIEWLRNYDHDDQPVASNGFLIAEQIEDIRENLSQGDPEPRVCDKAVWELKRTMEPKGWSPAYTYPDIVWYSLRERAVAASLPSSRIGVLYHAWYALATGDLAQFERCTRHIERLLSL
ncbi:MAG: hypothetical protein Q9166_003819, partial [cf. Caloplaca sp. 2 TL-2023]